MTREAVHSAAVALCRALLADAGLSVEDLRARATRRQARRAAAPKPDAAAVNAAAPAQEPPKEPPRAVLVAPQGKPLDRAARLAGVGRPVPGVVAKPRPMQGEVIVPEGVKFTVCPSGQDMRYRVDPAQVIEGGFLAEFRAKLGHR